MKSGFDNPAPILVNTMIANRDFETQQQIDDFLDALTKLTTWKSTINKTDYYPDLFYCFDDESYLPLIITLIYYMESYDPEFRVDTLIDVTELHLQRASRYLTQFYMSLIHGSDTFSILCRKYPLLPEHKKYLVETILLNGLKNWGEPDDEESWEIYRDVKSRIQRVLQKEIL